MLYFINTHAGWEWCYENSVGDCSYVAVWPDGELRRITWIDDTDYNEGTGRIVNALANGVYGRWEEA